MLLLNFYGNMLTASIGGRLHNLANCLCDSAVTPDNHTCITFVNGENEFYVITVDGLVYINSVGIVNYGARNVGKHLLKFHNYTVFAKH